MIMLKIVAFYALLAAFIAASWLWHRVWFGRGDGIISDDRSDPRDTADKYRAGKAVFLNAGVGTVALVMAVLTGLYLVIYALLA